MMRKTPLFKKTLKQSFSKIENNWKTLILWLMQNHAWLMYGCSRLWTLFSPSQGSFYLLGVGFWHIKSGVPGEQACSVRRCTRALWNLPAWWAPLSYLWPHLLIWKGPSGPQNEIQVPWKLRATFICPYAQRWAKKKIWKDRHAGSQKRLCLASFGLRSILVTSEGSGSFHPSKLPLALPAGPPHVIASATFSSLAPALAGRVAALRALRNQPNHLHLLIYFTRSTAGALLATAAEGDWR